MATKANDTKRAAIEATINLPSQDGDDAGLTPMSLPLGTLQLDFQHGKTLTLDAGQLTPEVIGQALMHGLKQKLVDAAAIARDTNTGKAATIETKFDAIKEVMDRLLAGEWNKRREGGPTGGLLKRALIEMYTGRKTPEQIEAYLDGKSDKEKAALRKNPKVAEIIERMRKEDAKATGEDVGVDLLAELEADDAAADGGIPAGDAPAHEGA